MSRNEEEIATLEKTEDREDRALFLPRLLDEIITAKSIDFAVGTPWAHDQTNQFSAPGAACPPGPARIVLPDSGEDCWGANGGQITANPGGRPKKETPDRESIGPSTRSIPSVPASQSIGSGSLLVAGRLLFVRLRLRLGGMSTVRHDAPSFREHDADEADRGLNQSRFLP